MVLADLALVYLPDLAPSISIIATVLAIVGAAKFTETYPKRSTEGP